MLDVPGKQRGAWVTKELQVRGYELEDIADGMNGEIFLVTLAKGAIPFILMPASAESIMVRIAQDNF